MLENRESVQFGNISVWPPVAVAPMVGLSHSALRSLVMGCGGVGLLYTEMLAAKRLPSDNPTLSPMLVATKQEQPLIYQLVTGTVEHIPAALEKTHRLGAAGVDLNLGCPAPIQKRQGAGASLALNRRKLIQILQCIRRHTDLPLSVKIRLGVKVDDDALAETCRFYEGEGVDLITVHARIVGEKFCRKPRWSAIAAAKDAVTIPVFANGGIFSCDDARKCLERSGADGIMIGRAAAEKPWICAEISKHIFGVQPSSIYTSKKDVFYAFYDLLVSRFPEEKRMVRLKHFSRYYGSSFTFGHHLTSCVLRSETMDEARERVERFFDKTAHHELILNIEE